MKLNSMQALAGFLIGTATGLVIAGAAALYLTGAPAPFVNKVQPSTENVTPVAEDPNRPLFSAHIPDAAPVPAAPPAEADKGAKASESASTEKSAEPSEPGKLQLQAGAYKSAEDADAARARLALMGLDAKVSEIQSEGVPLFRVRLGPFGKLDDLDGIRRTLAENGIEAQVVRQK